MSTTGIGAVQLVDVIPTLDIAGAYADGDLFFNPVTLDTRFWGPTHHSAIVQSLMVLDDADQSAAFDLLFMQASTSLGTFNAAFAPSDALAANIVGVISVAAGDYVDCANSVIAMPQFNPFVVAVGSGDKSVQDLWVAGVARDAYTAVAATDLHLRIGMVK